VFKLSFIPREEKFFEFFDEGVRTMVEAVQRLKRMLDNWEDIEGRVSEITRLEHRHIWAVIA